MSRLTFLLVLTSAANAAVTSHILMGPNLPARCSPLTGDVFFRTSVQVGIYQCTATNTWSFTTPVSGTFNSRGVYASGTTYAALDLASYNGVAYVSLQNSNTGHQPDISPTFWATPGPAGPQGVIGNTGSAGSNGSNGTNGTNGAISRIYNSGAPLPIEPFLDFVNGGCVDNPGSTKTDCTITGSGGAISFSGNPNTSLVVCPATSGSPVTTGIDTATGFYWACAFVSGSTTTWSLLSSSVGTGAYSVSGVAGTVNTGTATSRPATPADGYLYCATDTFAFTQYSTVNGWSANLTPSGSMLIAFTPTGLVQYLTGSCTPVSSGGLADPGSNGIVKRTALNTTSIATAGADYYAPGTMVSPGDGGTGTNGSISGVPMANGSSAWTKANAKQINAPAICLGTANSGTAETCSTSPTFTPAAGDMIVFKNGTVANSGAFTINVNSTSAAAVVKQGGGIALATNDILAGQTTILIMDVGGSWEMQGQTGNGASGSSSIDCTLATNHCLVEDFVTGDGGGTGRIGTNGFQFTVLLSGTCLNQNVSTISSNLPGVFRLSAAASPSAGSGCGIGFGNTVGDSNYNTNLLTSTAWDLDWYAAISSAADIRVRVGLAVNHTALVPPSNGGWFFRYDTNATYGDLTKNSGLGTWVVQTCTTCTTDTGGTTVQLTQVPTVASHRFHMWRTLVDSTIHFQVDNGTPVTACASGCSITLTNTANTGMSPFFTCGTDTTTTKFCDVDFMAFKIQGITRF